MTYRNNVPPSHENVCLSKRDSPIHDLCRPRHDEQRVAVLLQLGVLMSLSRIFDRQRVEIELGLNALQQLLAGFEQTDPDDMTVLLGPPASFIDGNILDPPAERIDAGGDHTRLVAWFRNSSVGPVHGTLRHWASK